MVMGSQIRQDRKKGFTVVELIVVIIVIGILVSVSIVGFSTWRKSVAEKEVKSDLNGVAAAMSNYRNFNEGYPTAPTFTGSGALFEQSDNVVLTYVTGTNKTFCINGASSVNTAVKFYLNETSPDAKTGSCPLSAPMDLNVAVISSTRLTLSWSGLVGASSYNWERSTASNFSANLVTGTVTSPTLATINLSPDTTYYYRLKAVSSSGTSGYSSTASGKTQKTQWTPSFANGTTSTGCSTSCVGTITVGFNVGYTQTGNAVAGSTFETSADISCSTTTTATTTCGTPITMTISVTGSGVQVEDPDTGTYGATYVVSYGGLAKNASYSTAPFRISIPASLQSNHSINVSITSKPANMYIKGDNSKINFTLAN